MISDTVAVIDKIAFHAEDQFKSRDIALFLAVFICGICVIKALNDTVVGNGTSRMAHTVRRFDQVLRLDHRILLAHFSVGMKFHTLFFRGIFTLFRRFGDIKALNGRIDLTVELTVSDRTADSDISAFSVLII